MRTVPIVAAVALSLPSVALAHGPCGPPDCLSPTSGPPGTEVTIRDTPAYWVMWNFRGLPQDGALGPNYRQGFRTFDLVKLRRARRDVRFRIPKVPPGPYPVTIFDGSEAGHHYTWALLNVTRDEGGPRWGALGGAVLGGALLLVLAYGARRWMSQPSPSRR